MRHTIKLPKLGDTTEEVVVLEWLVAEGDTVAVGDPLFRAETDKVVTDVPAPVAGVLMERLVAEQDEVPNGTPIAVIMSS